MLEIARFSATDRQRLAAIHARACEEAGMNVPFGTWTILQVTLYRDLHPDADLVTNCAPFVEWLDRTTTQNRVLH